MCIMQHTTYNVQRVVCSVWYAYSHLGPTGSNGSSVAMPSRNPAGEAMPSSGMPRIVPDVLCPPLPLPLKTC